jgi:ATP/maltotriose-dependent transcriptional regulator MalT
MPVETIFRRRLVGDLQKVLANRHLLIAAPPGYGKTHLLQQLAFYQPETYYLLLTPADSDTAVLQSRLQPHQQPGHTLLLDDIHHLAGYDTAVNWLAQQLTNSNCHYVLAGRFLPGGLDHLLADGQAVHWDESKLLFDPAESRALLADKASQSEAWAVWHEQLAGWPLGLALLARLPARDQTPKVAQQQLFAYLAHELFDQLPADLYHFLQVTAVPLTFNDQLASHLLDDDNAAGLRQIAIQRNLFLYQDERPGWFRYHDLIRDYLLTQQDELHGYWQKTIAWFEAQDDLPQAIEHALAAGWQDEAARLISLVSPTYIYDNDRYLTYRRWVEALDEQIRARQPLLLFRLGHFLNFLEKHKALARTYVTQALAAAETAGNRRMALFSRWQLAVFTQEEAGPTEALLAELADLATAPEVAMYASRTYAHALTDDGRFFAAVAAWRRVVALAEADGTPDSAWAARRTLALTALLPMGRFTQAANLFTGALDYFADEPGWHYETLQNSGELHFARGAWSALAAALGKIDELEQMVESLAVHNVIWTNYYRGLLAVADGRFADAEQHLAVMTVNFNAGDRRCEIPLARARSWLLRRRGKLAQAVVHAETELDNPPVFPH